jgi:hypothetical protein
MLILKLLTMAIGAFLIVWSISLRRLPTAQRPAFSDKGWFWTIPCMGCLICLIGFGTALQHSLIWSVLALFILLVLMTLIWRHDQYSAVIRILFDDYRRLQRENPDSTDFDILYSIVKSCRPLWTEDRILEFSIGKSINQVVLLMLIMEYEIHPINDMDLYQRLKVQVEAMGGKLKKGQPDHRSR